MSRWHPRGAGQPLLAVSASGESFPFGHAWNHRASPCCKRPPGTCAVPVDREAGPGSIELSRCGSRCQPGDENAVRCGTVAGERSCERQDASWAFRLRPVSGCQGDGVSGNPGVWPACRLTHDSRLMPLNFRVTRAGDQRARSHRSCPRPQPVMNPECSATWLRHSGGRGSHAPAPGGAATTRRGRDATWSLEVLSSRDVAVASVGPHTLSPPRRKRGTRLRSSRAV
jgi:hypothetical protein